MDHGHEVAPLSRTTIDAPRERACDFTGANCRVRRPVGDELQSRPSGLMRGYFDYIRSLTAAPLARHRSEQNLTCFQSRAHFLRQAKGRSHAAQTLVGKLSFL